MQTDLENEWYRSEDHYLDKAEMVTFREEIDVLRQRLVTYEILRDRELSLFQTVADNLCQDFSEESPKSLERVLKHWIAVLRYSAMALLLNNPDYLRHHLLEWLTDIVKADQKVKIVWCLYEHLTNELGEILSNEQFMLFHPFLEQAKTTLLTESTPISAVL